MYLRLKDKFAVITGGGQGIGEAIALLLADEGATVAIVGRTELKLSKVVRLILDKGGKALCFKADVSKEKEVLGLARKIKQTFPRIDILVNNAAIVRSNAIEKLSILDWDDVININLRGTFLCSQVIGKIMIEQKIGNIINIASVAGHMPAVGRGSYSPSKAAIISLTKLLAMEWSEYNIRVNSVSPGSVLTPLTTALLDERARELKISTIPSKRPAKPEEVAKLVLFLASDESCHITGEDIVIDGGHLPSLYYQIRKSTNA
jgi:NAD(P)-dependent dehydrogenase (short-subunit alcohol dehydrogenase family)